MAQLQGSQSRHQDDECVVCKILCSRVDYLKEEQKFATAGLLLNLEMTGSWAVMSTCIGGLSFGLKSCGVYDDGERIKARYMSVLYLHQNKARLTPETIKRRECR